MRLAALLAAAYLPAMASAIPMNVVTFDAPHAGTWIENDVTITPTSEWTPAATGEVGHLDAGSVPYSKWLDFTLGSLFTPISVDVMPGGTAICGPDEPLVRGEACTFSGAFAYMSFSGYVNDMLVSSIRLYSAVDFTLSLSILGAIDRLRIETLFPGEVGLSNQCWSDPCSHFSIDNVTLQSVPEPETIGLLALGLLGAIASRRRKAR